MAAYPPQLDHLVLAAPDLARAVAELEARLGVVLQPGGRHPAWGTRNAVLPLSPTAYLEVIGPDPDRESPRLPTLFGIATLTAPRLVTWAAKATRLAELTRMAGVHGIDLGEPGRGSRVRPDGSRLEWEVTDPFASREGGVLPFFIEWRGAGHLASSAPARVTLVRFGARHPEPRRVRAQLQALGLELSVEAGAQPALVAELGGPAGRVVLSPVG